MMMDKANALAVEILSNVPMDMLMTPPADVAQQNRTSRIPDVILLESTSLT
jgi:hypothetical protein